MKLYDELVEKRVPESRTACFEMVCKRDCALFGTNCQMELIKVR